MSEYQLSREAQDDLENIYRYGYYNFGETQADKYYDGLIQYFELIAEKPYQFPSIDHIKEGYRKGVYQSEKIYFRIDNQMVIIVAVLSRQDESQRL